MGLFLYLLFTFVVYGRAQKISSDRIYDFESTEKDSPLVIKNVPPWELCESQDIKKYCFYDELCRNKVDSRSGHCLIHLGDNKKWFHDHPNNPGVNTFVNVISYSSMDCSFCNCWEYPGSNTCLLMESPSCYIIRYPPEHEVSNSISD